jgi:hypothetical protein
MNQTNLAPVAGIAALSPIFPLLNSGTGIAYSGAQPASTQTALSGNTAIVTATFAATALSGSVTSSGGFASGSLAFTSTSLTAAATGVATFMRLTESGGTTVVADLTLGNAYMHSEPVEVGQLIYAGSNTYSVTTAGTTSATGSGPTGTGTGITDGTAVFAYAFSGQPAVLVVNANISNQTTVTITSAELKIPVN